MDEKDVIVTADEKIIELEKRMTRLENMIGKLTKKKVIYKPFLYKKSDDDPPRGLFG